MGMEERYILEKGHHRSSLFAASLWMIVISLVLFFVPVINGFIGGLVGGYKAGTALRGVEAALIPALIVAAGLGILLAMFHAPTMAIISGLTGFVVVALSSIGIILGGAVGGLISNSMSHRRRIPITV
jgi:hypothetical protein